MSSEQSNPQKILDGVFNAYVNGLNSTKVPINPITDVPEEAYTDLQDTMRQEILFRISQVLDDYNIEPARKPKNDR